MSIDIVRAGPADLEVGRALRLAMLAESPGAFLTTSAEVEAWSEQMWRTWWLRSTGPGFVFCYAVAAGSPIGAIRCASEGGTAHLYSFWVHPDHRGSLAAIRLLRNAEEWAAEQGCREAALTVMDCQDRALAFYGRAGYCRTGKESTPPGAGGARAIEMARALGPADRAG